jgi:hypothetical protein
MAVGQGQSELQSDAEGEEGSGRREGRRPKEKRK